MDARGEREHFDHELQHASPVGNNSSENIDIFAESPGFQHGSEYLYHANEEENMRPVPLMSGHTTHTVSQSQETHDYNVKNDERLHALFPASVGPSAAAETNHGQRRLSEIEDNLHGVQRKLGEIGEHFSAFSNTLERLLLGTGTAASGSSHILPPVASQGVSNSLFSANASESPGILPSDPLRVASSYGVDMLHPTASGNLFCAGALDAAPGILPPYPLRVAAPHGLDMRHNAASGNLFYEGASDAAPGILPPDPLHVATSSAQEVLSSPIAPFPVATNDISRTPLSSTKTGCLETQETKTHVDQEQEYEILSFREEIIQEKRWPLRITSKLSTDRGTLYNMSKGGDLTFTFSLQELEAETVESTSVYYATTEKNETARSVRKRHSLTLAELRRRNSRLDKIEKLGERSKFKKNTFLNVGDATTKKPRTRFQCRDGKL